MTEQIIDIHTGELIEPGDTDLFPMLSPDPEIQDILAEVHRIRVAKGLPVKEENQ